MTDAEMILRLKKIRKNYSSKDDEALTWAMECIRFKRPQGEWEHWGSPFSDDSIANSIVCSLCKARYVEIDGEVFNFCPNCGSDNRKRGEANEQTTD